MNLVARETVFKVFLQVIANTPIQPQRLAILGNSDLETREMILSR